MNLGVNIDHIAVLREARLVNDPNPVDALLLVELAGANQVTIHLREDRRHINDDDAQNIIRLSSLPVNLECSINKEIIKIIQELKPFRATLVPENRQEVTTEGGLDLKSNFKSIKQAIKQLKKSDIYVSLFIDPNKESITLSKELGADMIELHTGAYSNISLMYYSNLSRTKYSIKSLEKSKKQLKTLLQKSIANIKESADYAKKLGLEVVAGHGLNYKNVKEIASLNSITELNIGQSIIARSVFVGLKEAIKEMKELIG